MKKIIGFLIVLVFLLVSLAGCTQGAVPPIFSQELPWSYGTSATTETATYSFQRFYQIGKEEKSPMLKSGEMKYTLSEGKSLDKDMNTISHSDYTLITMELTCSYLDALPTAFSVYVGKTDRIVSKAVIGRYSLAPIFTYKKTEIAAQSEDDTQSFEIKTDFTGNFLGKKVSEYKDKNGKKSLTIKEKKEFYDSETLYFQLRAMRNINAAANMTTAYNIASPLDDIFNGESKLKIKGAEQKTAQSTVALPVSENVFDIFDVPANSEQETEGGSEENNEEENNEDDTEQETTTDTKALSCFKTDFHLTENNAGSSIFLYFSAFPIKVNADEGYCFAATKVIAKIEYETRSAETNLVFFQEYTLKSYRNQDI